MSRSLLVLFSLWLVVLTTSPAFCRQEGKLPKDQLLKAELFIAIRDNNLPAVKAALAQGADPNARNWLEFTPLMWATNRGNPQIVETLLAHGAELNAQSSYGSPLTFAVMGRHEKIALALLTKGAHPDASRLDGATPLMLAAANDNVELIGSLLTHKSDPNKRDADKATALIYAARLGQTAAVQALLKGGADVNAADSHGRTALLYAAQNDYPKTVALLTANHAGINRKDNQGATALLLAARYHGDPAVIRTLLGKGADATVVDGTQRTALALAQARDYNAAATLLRAAGPQASVRETGVAPTLSPGKAVETSLVALQTGMQTFAKRAACTSCHHQGLGLMTLGLARRHGFAVKEDLVGSYLKNIGEEGQAGAGFIHQALSDANVAKTIPAVDIGDISIGAAYIFNGLIANDVPSNPRLAEMALFLANQQAADGHWGFGMDREPIQSSYVTTTALALQVVRTYGPAEKADQLAQCYARSRQWLLTTAAPTTEDKASRLMGLKWAGASKEEIQKLVPPLLGAQREDGGWSQLPSLHSDAYATGLALYCLHVGAGMPTDDPVYQRGVRYLLRTQEEDGSWYVNKRAMPANTYFDAGFPHGESQFISFGATCWATMALLQTVEPPQTARR